jgi:hypothetical protein
MAIKPFKMPDVDAAFKQLNPNQVAPGNAAGLGSGNLLGQPNPVTAETFTMPNLVPDPVIGDEPTGGTTYGDPDVNGGMGGEEDETAAEQPGQTPLELLQSFFPDADVAELEKLTRFVSVIPQDIYDAADADNEMYQLMRQERTGQLESARDMSESLLRDSLFRNLEQARGMEGKRGFALGRNIYGDVSDQAATRFMGVQSDFGRGLYNINEEILGRVRSARQYLTSLESRQRADLLKLADLADLFEDTDDDNDQFEGSTDQDDYMG